MLQVKNRNTVLLEHPVVRSYIYEKWKSQGIGFYFLDFMFYIIFLGFLSLFVVVVNHPLSDVCKEVQNCES
jgi:hypothetical protein